MYQSIVMAIKNLSYLEMLAFASGIGYVCLAVRENIACWWVGIVNIFAMTILSYQSRLYADVGLQLVYLWLTIQGLYLWQKNNKATSSDTILKVSKTSIYEWKKLIITGLFFWVICIFLLKNYSNTDVAVWDSGVVVLSLVATWQTAHKKIENWIVWVITDLLYIGLYYYKALYLLMLLSVVYCILAVIGFYTWKKKLNNSESYIESNN